jgi:2-dehydro-3-deoxyphosphogluconate aldolase/(4S)-4-hydroxy-2-oxoglutarate aldolase
MSSRTEILDAVLDAGLISIIRLNDAQALHAAAEAIHAGGIRVIEFTLNSPGALDAIRSCRKTMDDTIIGAGTVLSRSHAEEAIAAGAQIVVSPDTKPEVVETAHALGAVAIPGAFTPTEIARAMDLGADLVKLFPAKGLGPQYVREIRGPLDGVRLVPTGGVTVKNVAAYFDAGAAAVAVGGGIVNNDLVQSGDFETIQANAQAFSQAVARARAL